MFHKIQEICTKIGTRIFKIDQEMTEKIELKVGTPQKVKLKMGQFEPPQKFFLFLKMKFIHFFLIPTGQKYQNESAPIFYNGKSPKTNRKYLKLPYLQALALGRIIKMTLYYSSMIILNKTI